jgi:hypothetical protein
LLCWHHHDHVHTHGIEIHWKPGDGQTPGCWEFTDRNGQPIRR